MRNTFTHPFKRVAKRYRAFRVKLPHVVSNMALNDFKSNFKRQGYINENGVFIPWAKTSTKNLRAMGKRSKGILIGKGRLMRSMRRSSTYNEARVTTNLPYAKAHNQGFKATVKVSAHTRNKYNKRLESARTRRGTTTERNVNVVKDKTQVKAHSRKMNIKKRPFMVTSKTLNDDIEKYIFKELDKIWNT